VADDDPKSSGGESAEARRGEDDLLACVLESVSDGIVVLDRDFHYTYWNGSMARLSETPSDRVLGRAELPWQIFPHLAEQGVDEMMRKAMAGEVVTQSAIPYRLASGKTGYTDETFMPLHGRNGEIRGVVGVVREVTERQLAEEQLRSSEERYRSVVELAPDGIVLVSPTGVIMDCNCAVLDFLGLEREEVVGKHFSRLSVLTEDQVRSFLQQFSAAVLGERRGPVELTWQHSDGTARIGEVRSAPLVVGGTTVGLLATIRDTTERSRALREHEQLEGQLRHRQRMEAIGALAGGIAHDFNNLLAAILGSASLISLAAEPDGEIQENAELIERAAGRGALLTRQLLGFASRGKLRNTTVDLGEIAGSIAAILERTTHRRIEIAVDRAGDAPYVTGDPAQLEQVVMNLAVNARDAMPRGGRLCIGTDCVDIGADGNPDHVDLAPGRYVRLSVSDDGCGMSAEVKQRAFEPFFTTKPVGEGSGMGLATVYGIVRSHHGSVAIRSQSGAGTEVEILLPRANIDRVDTSRDRPQKLVHGTGCVLVVDDEQAVRAVIRKTLERLGYQALGVSSGAEALDYLRSHPQQVDLVILDLVMPEMDGRECFRRITALDPAQKVLLATGHSAGQDAYELIEAGAVGVLEKPFSAAELSLSVAAATQQLPEPHE